MHLQILSSMSLCLGERFFTVFLISRVFIHSVKAFALVHRIYSSAMIITELLLLTSSASSEE